MTHLTIDSLSIPRNFDFFIQPFVAIRAAFCDRHLRRQALRKVKSELDQYSEAEIVELGISQADISFIAEDAARR